MLGVVVGLWLQTAVGMPGTHAIEAAQQPGQGSAGRVHATVTLNKDTVTIAEHFTATVRLRAPRGSTFDIPAGLDTVNGAGIDTAGAFERFDADTADGYSDVTAIYTLAAWDVGPQRLGLDSIVVHFPGGIDTTIRLDRVDTVVTHTAAGDSTMLKPRLAIFVRRTLILPKNLKMLRPKPPHDLIPEAAEIAQRRREQARTYGTFAIALLAAAFLAWFGYRRYVKSRLTGPAPDPVELEFQRVEAMHLIEHGKPEQHAVLMADVVRRYLVRHFPVVRESATTFEMRRVLPKVDVLPAEQMLALFEQIDLFKFAHVTTDADAARTLGAQSRAVVREILARQAAREEAERLAQLAQDQRARGRGTSEDGAKAA